MIRRDAGSDLLLITQHDHARAAGELARRFGNLAFARPDPFEPTAEGVAYHDAGWPLHDDDPTLNKGGVPLHVFEVPVGTAIRVWSASTARAAELGDWQGLLVSLHVLNLSALNMAHIVGPSRADVFEMNKFQHRQIEIQEELRRRLGLVTEEPLRLGLAAAGSSAADDRLLHAFRVLTFMDRISLTLCCGKLLFPSVEDVMCRPGELPTPVRMEMPDDATIRIAPWPFDRDEIELEVGGRRVPRGPYESAEVYGRVYRSAPTEPLRLCVRRG